MKVIEVNPQELIDSPFQPRTKYRGIEELGESMKSGILHPLVARLANGQLELVAGHRRKRGAIYAKLDSVPVSVVEMTDEQVIDAIGIENLQREDISPLEELAIYEAMDGTPEEAAFRLGVSPSRVHRRLRLRGLIQEGRDALDRGDLRLTVAEFIAALSDKDQEEAIPQLVGNQFNDPAGMTRAVNYVTTQVMRKISRAIFDPEDATLLPVAGPCSACPKNTANEGTLFPMEDKEARCVDSTCWSDKNDAEWDRRVASADPDRVSILDEEQIKSVYPNGYLSKKWIDLNKNDYSGSRTRTYREVIGKKRLADLKIGMFRNRFGEIVEVVLAAAAKKACIEQPKKSDPPELSAGGASNDSFDAKIKAEQKLARTKLKVSLDLLERKTVEGALDELDADSLWYLLGLGAISRSWAATVSLAAKRRKLVPIKGSEETPLGLLVAWLANKERTVAERKALTMEMLAIPSLQGSYGDVLRDPLLEAYSMTEADIATMAKEALKAKEKKPKAAKEPPLDDERNACPICKAAAGKRCKSVKGRPIDAKLRQFHVERKEVVNAGDAAESNDAPDTGATDGAEPTAGRLLAMVDAGKTYAEIGEKFGLSKDQVARRVKAARSAK